jgi:hypothetical protein
MNELDIFDDDDGLLQQPTMRGNANLDIQDYQGGEDGGDLLDEIQEDVPSTPGSGAAPAPDVDGTSEYEMADEDDGGPGMTQTTYGASPWGPGSGTGYQPMSMRATDLSGSEEQVNPAPSDPQMNPEPSNRGVDPLTLYDRSSYEFTNSEQDTIGSGIFSNEEGATFRARDGQFAHQYALPEYIANEDELGVEQSDMWDEVAENWRVVQPSGGGVTFSRRVAHLKPGGRAYSPFSQGAMPEMRPDVKGPKSHVEAFGRKVASAVVNEARSLPPQQRGAFLSAAVNVLGPNMAERCKRTAERLTTLGYQPETALEDAIAHCVMHATVEDLTKGRGALPRLDKLTTKVRGNGAKLRGAAQQHVAPLLADQRKLRGDLGALYNSAAAAGMGEVAQDAAAPATPPGIIPIISNRNLVIAAAAVGALFVFSQTETGQKVQANVGRSAKRMWRQVRRAARRVQ